MTAIAVQSTGDGQSPRIGMARRAVIAGHEAANAAPLDAAFVDLKTPPVVPMYTVLPLASAGSTATLSTRPPAAPVAALVRLLGASGVHGTFNAAVCAIPGTTAIPSSSSPSPMERRAQSR